MATPPGIPADVLKQADAIKANIQTPASSAKEINAAALPSRSRSPEEIAWANGKSGAATVKETGQSFHSRGVTTGSPSQEAKQATLSTPKTPDARPAAEPPAAKAVTPTQQRAQPELTAVKADNVKPTAAQSYSNPRPSTPPSTPTPEVSR